MSEHTPGPWEEFIDERGEVWVSGSNGWVCYIGDMEDTTAEDHYNARLIAAAPDLLEALKEIAKGEGAFSLDPLTFAENTIENMKEIAQAAIAKVEAEPGGCDE